MELNYEIIGSGSIRKCIFLHGVLGQGKNWRSFARHLSSEYQCLIYDQRGHGKSEQPSSGYTMEIMAQDLRGLIGNLGWDSGKVDIVGHSMGGRVALTFANQFADLVGKLVIVDIGPQSNWVSMESILTMVESVPVPFPDRAQAKSYLVSEFQERHGAAMAQFMLTNIGALENGEWGWVFSKSGLKQILTESRLKDHWDAFKSLNMPTLLLRGEKSTYLSLEDFKKIQEANPKIVGQQINGAGHWLHAEKPVETLKALKSFFNIDEALS